MTVVGRIYLERGEPVEVLAQWLSRGATIGDTEQRLGDEAARVLVNLHGHEDLKPAPRNVLIRRASGELVVRPLRGLRRP